MNDWRGRRFDVSRRKSQIKKHHASSFFLLASSLLSSREIRSIANPREKIVEPRRTCDNNTVCGDTCGLMIKGSR